MLNTIKEFEINIINYKKLKNKIANISLNLKLAGSIMVEEINYSEDKNLIILKDLYFANGNFNSLKSLQVKTYKSNSKNNEFSIELGEKYYD